MRCVVIGMGVQGKKRAAFASSDLVATVDNHLAADYKNILDVPLDSYDAALVCTPDEVKIDILTYLLSHKKHVLVEKPLIADDSEEISKLKQLAEKNGVTCYTAYNHRFEPHFVRMRDLIHSEKLGEIYRCSLFYGNGTALDVKNSPWRDKDSGVLKDIGSHLLDLMQFWFEVDPIDYKINRCHRFENKSPDYVSLSSNNPCSIDLEMTLLSWRNHFRCDVYGEKGSAHIDSLCKWGPSSFTVRERILPSGRPTEEVITLTEPDPTWALEYQHFLQLCKKGLSNIGKDIIINTVLNNLKSEILTGV